VASRPEQAKAGKEPVATRQTILTASAIALFGASDSLFQTRFRLIEGAKQVNERCDGG
jgi:hypothetical protein